MCRGKINFVDVLDKYQNMNVERGNVLNRFFAGFSLYALTKVLSQIWGPRLTDAPRHGVRGTLPPALTVFTMYYK